MIKFFIKSAVSASVWLCVVLANDVDFATEADNAESTQDLKAHFDVKKYGKHLYENPRGIACDKCHGKQGEGSIIANYKHKGANKTLIAPRINNIELDRFYKALHSQKGIMPIYYLSDDEIVAIYEYLKQ